MSTVGNQEMRTQQRVVVFFRDPNNCTRFVFPDANFSPSNPEMPEVLALAGKQVVA